MQGRADCEAFGKCGGCVFRHISYDEECRIKYERVRDCISRIAKLDIIPDGIIAADKTDGYRNKAQLPIGIDEKGEPFADFMQKKATELSKSATAVSSLPSFSKITEIFINHLKKRDFGV